MKKLLGIVVLGLLLSGNTYASCMDEVKMNAIRLSNSQIQFELLNFNNKIINITEIKIFTSNNETIRRLSLDQTLQPFGKKYFYMQVGDLNLAVWKKSTFSCRYK